MLWFGSRIPGSVPFGSRNSGICQIPDSSCTPSPGNLGIWGICPLKLRNFGKSLPLPSKLGNFEEFLPLPLKLGNFGASLPLWRISAPPLKTQGFWRISAPPLETREFWGICPTKLGNFGGSLLVTHSTAIPSCSCQPNPAKGQHPRVGDRS